MSKQDPNLPEGTTLTTGGTGSLSTAGTRGAKIEGTPEETPGPGPRIMAASTLEGDEVRNRQGEKLGTLEEIMLDVGSGRIAYAVLATGGFLGIGDKLFAIPWPALTLDTDNECFILDVDRERLQNAPGFDKNHWPAMADERWASELHRYYGTDPYWS
ncbi:MAG: PRC-barrel domain-containing protein [Pseudomonadota bacterium]